MYKIYWIVFFLFFSSFSIAQTFDSPQLSPILIENKYGYVDPQQKITIEPQFDEALPFTGKYAFVKKDNKWGLINSKGKLVIPATYQNLGWTNNKTIAPEASGEVIGYQENGKWGLITVKNKIVTAPVYSELEFFGGDRIKAGSLPDSQADATLFNIINTKGKEILSLQSHSVAILPLSDKLLVGQNKIYYGESQATGAHFIQEYGIKNWNNEVVLPLQYKKISEKGKNEFDVVPFNEWKIMTPSGESVIRVDSLYPVFANIYAIEANGLKGYITLGQPTMQVNMQTILPGYLGFSIFKKGNKYGVTSLNSQNKLYDFLPAVYDSLVVDSSGFVKAGKLTGAAWQWELFVKNNQGESVTVSKQPYHAIHQIKTNGFTKVMKDKQYGFIDKEGNEVIPLQYDSLSEFIDSLCVVVYQGKYGILKKNGNWHLQPQYDYYALNQFGHAIRKEKAQYEVIDVNEKKKHTTTSPLRFMPDGSIEISQKGKVGRISPWGVPCIPAAYDSISPVTSDFTFWAIRGNQIFLFNATGDMLVKQGDLMKDLHYEKSNFAPVKINGRYGFIDGLGRLRITNQYEGAQPFSEGLAAVKFAGKWGYLNKEDKIIVQPYYDEVSPFQNGYAIVKKGRKYGLIDAKSKESSAFIYDQITRHPTGVFITTVNGKKGLLSATGKELIYAKYEQVYPQTDGTVVVQLEGKFGLVAQNSVSIYPIHYDAVIVSSYTKDHMLLTRSKEFRSKV